MKRLVLLSISFVIVIFLSSCTGNPVQPNENNMILSIKNYANFDFHTIEISTDNTTSGIRNADGSKIQK
ncbi:hypothetical protein [Bacillus sp. REN3]|uniref:hypothetical protein n=1 Tax=Bacillus sp. REN3 TaxID=2802440 RepID=UPI001AEE0287|nr:hypothetical protein [Bacillus sp. REN3]